MTRPPAWRRALHLTWALDNRTPTAVADLQQALDDPAERPIACLAALWAAGWVLADLREGRVQLPGGDPEGEDLLKECRRYFGRWVTLSGGAATPVATPDPVEDPSTILTQVVGMLPARPARMRVDDVYKLCGRARLLPPMTLATLADGLLAIAENHPSAQARGVVLRVVQEAAWGSAMDPTARAALLPLLRQLGQGATADAILDRAADLGEVEAVAEVAPRLTDPDAGPPQRWRRLWHLGDVAGSTALFSAAPAPDRVAILRGVHAMVPAHRGHAPRPTLHRAADTLIAGLCDQDAAVRAAALDLFHSLGDCAGECLQIRDDVASRLDPTQLVSDLTDSKQRPLVQPTGAQTVGLTAGDWAARALTKAIVAGNDHAAAAMRAALQGRSVVARRLAARALAASFTERQDWSGLAELLTGLPTNVRSAGVGGALTGRFPEADMRAVLDDVGIDPWTLGRRWPVRGALSTAARTELTVMLGGPDAREAYRLIEEAVDFGARLDALAIPLVGTLLSGDHWGGDPSFPRPVPLLARASRSEDLRAVAPFVAHYLGDVRDHIHASAAEVCARAGITAGTDPDRLRRLAEAPLTLEQPSSAAAGCDEPPLPGARSAAEALAALDALDLVEAAR